jgi:hypothetical protein
MSFRTIEVDVVNGRVQPTGADQLPDRARGLLTLLDEIGDGTPKGELKGLKRFLELPAIPSTVEQVRASLEEDYYDQ